MVSTGTAAGNVLRLGHFPRAHNLTCLLSTRSPPQRQTARVTKRSASSDSSSVSPDTPPPEDLAEKLAAAEAEADALRRELAMRKAAEPGSPPSNRPKIDGIGFRETIFAGPTTGGKLARKEGGSSAWGFSEAELLQSEGGLQKLAAAYGTDADDKPIDKEEAKRIIQRRLLLGVGMSAVVAALAYVEIPVTVAPPQKPLYVYLVPLLRLQSSLATVQEQAEYLDALGLRAQLKLATGSISSIKDNILSATALLQGPPQAEARVIAFDILNYLEQADYSKYFEGMGVPGPYQQTEYIKFSLQSLEVAQKKLSQFFALIPEEPLQSARMQLQGLSQL